MLSYWFCSLSVIVQAFIFKNNLQLQLLIPLSAKCNEHRAIYIINKSVFCLLSLSITTVNRNGIVIVFCEKKRLKFVLFIAILTTFVVPSATSILR